ncbi:GNAT family N-acetyltransferase [Mucilaginibacter terrae]|uniref:Ribosomal-protein-alanine N-acetyltransferase n=1 Tax=Mucilaginibacter terrae TaxID=1955052 RepID=A0ABU3GY43_9SPHI|nr:GNAT family N-acetyltransferase [Mucilaginibacter terrae]MDT3404679.1 ribosomal-protein-alanine N-acetyltransferase [Mucilaginibacter terrae]
MFTIQSQRLILIPLTNDQLKLSAQNRYEFEQSIGLNPSAMLINDEFKAEMNEAMQNFWLPNTQSYPDLYLWYTNWQVVLKASNTIIGGIAFGGYPDDYGQTSIGYMIDQNLWGNDYATEALKAALNWGFTFSILKAVNADTPVSNTASQRVLLKAGFKQTHTDDGLLYYKATK